jgi:glycosyltransferase involved in cell wall biosynthesis
MKVNILLVTFNHEKYIRQCLNSILMQQLEAEVEVIVADDLSSDQTMAIIREYAMRNLFPFVFLDTKNHLGFVQNYKRAFAACKGDYIAVMEGDDYWTDPMRLETHVKFLEKHRECVLSMNRYITCVESRFAFSVPPWTQGDDFEYVTAQQMALGNRLGNLSACVFRRTEIEKLKPDMFEFDISDWMFGIALGQFGLLAILKEAMSVYRVHSQGQWSRLNNEEQKKILLDVADKYNKYLEFRFDEQFIQYKQRLITPPVAKPAVKKYPLSGYFPPVMIYIVKLLVPGNAVRFLKSFFSRQG